MIRTVLNISWYCYLLNRTQQAFAKLGQLIYPLKSHYEFFSKRNRISWDGNFENSSKLNILMEKKNLRSNTNYKRFCLSFFRDFFDNSSRIVWYNYYYNRFYFLRPVIFKSIDVVSLVMSRHIFKLIVSYKK